MSDTKPPPMGGAAPGKGYKRSWKNLLINKRYQLRFTLFMVGISTVLMTGLGIWVMKVANETTTVSMASVRGTACPKIPALVESAPSEDDIPAVPMKLPEPGDAASAAPADTPPPAPCEPAPRHYPLASVSPIYLPNDIWWELERRLVLIYLGKSHSSSRVHEKVIRELENAGPDCPPLDDLRRTAELSRDALYAGDFAGLGQAMSQNTAAQSRLNSALSARKRTRSSPLPVRMGRWAGK